MALLSVVITVFNRDKYLKEAIKSVINSTYTKFELIIVDDCSTDNSYEIAKEFELKDSRIKVFRNECNLGDYPNRINSINYTNGELIKFIDADDKIYPWTLSAFYYAYLKYPEAALYISPTSSKINREFPFELKSNEIFRVHFFEYSLLDAGPSGVMFKKSAYENVGGFSGIRWIGDYELWFKISKKYSLVVINQGLVFWRQHEEQQIKTEKMNKKNHQKNFDDFFIPSLNNLDDNLLTENEKKQILKTIYKSFYRKALEKINNLILRLIEIS